MILTAPVSWPIAKILDWILPGSHEVAMMRRPQLKALVQLHASASGIGGPAAGAPPAAGKRNPAQRRGAAPAPRAAPATP